MSRRELFGSAAAGVMASVAATAVYAWLTTYTTLCERDIAGMTIVVWCAVLIRVLMLVSKEEAE